jgi:hypothetical protein
MPMKQEFGWPRPQAGGVLGLWFPFLISSEILHYGYAIVMLIGIWMLRKGFTGLSRKWWTVALVIQFWHHIEHLLDVFQGNIDVEEIAHRVDEDVLRLLPLQRTDEHLRLQREFKTVLVVGVPCRLQPLRHLGRFFFTEYVMPGQDCTVAVNPVGVVSIGATISLVFASTRSGQVIGSGRKNKAVRACYVVGRNRGVYYYL